MRDDPRTTNEVRRPAAVAHDGTGDGGVRPGGRHLAGAARTGAGPGVRTDPGIRTGSGLRTGSGRRAGAAFPGAAGRRGDEVLRGQVRAGERRRAGDAVRDRAAHPRRRRPVRGDPGPQQWAPTAGRFGFRQSRPTDPGLPADPAGGRGRGRRGVRCPARGERRRGEAPRAQRLPHAASRGLPGPGTVRRAGRPGRVALADRGCRRLSPY